MEFGFVVEILLVFILNYFNNYICICYVIVGDFFFGGFGMVYFLGYICGGGGCGFVF